MDSDWQNIAALIAVTLAATGLAMRFWRFRQKPLNPQTGVCRACHGCPKNDCRR